MKEYEMYFQKERAAYISAQFKGDNEDAALHMGRMQGYKRALYIMKLISYEESDKMHKEILSTIDFVFRMRERQRNRNK